MPKGAALIIGAEPESMGDDMSEDEAEGDVKAEAGNALASAIKSGDGRAICEAVKTIMDLEYEASEE